MKVYFIKMKKRNEKKKHFLKDKEEIMRICSATSFPAMLIIMHHTIQCRLSI